MGNLTIRVQELQSRLYSLINQLEAGVFDKIIVEEGRVLPPDELARNAAQSGFRTPTRSLEAIAEIVLYNVFVAADPGKSSTTMGDTQSDFQDSPAVYTADLYKLVKKIRDANKTNEPQTATATMSLPSAGASVLIDGETFTLSDFDSVITEIYEFDIGGGGVGAENTPVVLTGTESRGQLRNKIKIAINNDSTDIVASNGSAGSLLLTQSGPGSSGNVALSETVADSGFVLSDFSGGTDSGHVIFLRRSKNDPLPRVVCVSRRQARVLGL